MATAAITCLHPGLKTILVHEAESHIEDDEELRIFLDLLSSIADCQGMVIGLEAAQGGGVRVKRAPSAYNLFMKQCASSTAKGGDGKDFKACGLEWKRKKEK